MKRLTLALLAAVCLFVAAVDARASAPGLTLDLEGARSLWVQDEDGEWYAYFPPAPDFVNERFIERWVVEPPSTTGTVPVAWVVDGDTIDVTIWDETRRVRLLLVDTPEVRPTECYGPEASEYVSSLLPEGSEVRLERDVTDTDAFGRLLRYVYLPDGRMLNELLLEGGYATVFDTRDEEQHEQRLLDAQTRARAASAGLWTACETENESEADADAASDESSEDGCDAAYPDVCIPPPPPDLNCADIEHRDIRVLPPDPHELDRDGDGVGCRS
ncbi:MAG: nuclease [Chloroflexi bacterium]|nr:nuclease [Chloroflexota bacterium]